jgi:CheY-like chemotaxis protein
MIARPANTPATILIVDDIAANRYLLHELLDTGEYLLLEAPDGPAALEMARKAPPTLSCSTP